MQSEIKDSKRVSPFLAFYLITSVQIGVGVLGFQRNIAKYAGYDSWISVILAGLLFNVVIWIMYKLLNSSGGDLISIHRELFGKWIGGFLSTLFIIYVLLEAFGILSSFIKIIEVWMFPDLSSWGFGFIYLLLVYYAVTRGFRVVAGICFFGVVLPAYLYLTFLIPWGYGDVRHLLPILSHTPQEILQATREMTYSYLGVELLLFYYPYIKNPKASQKWAHFGNFYSIFAYTLITISTFVYYSEGKLSHTIWATLNMWKIIRFPIVERFEIVGITTWILVILPNICLLVWAASRSAKSLFHLRQKTFLIIFLMIIYVPLCLIHKLDTINQITRFTGKIGFYNVYVYIPLLAILYLIVKKVRKKHEEN